MKKKAETIRIDDELFYEVHRTKRAITLTCKTTYGAIRCQDELRFTPAMQRKIVRLFGGKP